jgi:hypothetical protein
MSWVKERTMPRKAIGNRRWAIAEGYIPRWSHGPEPQMLSHETVCILNLDDPEKIAPGTDYASLIESDIPIVVQHTRLDSRQAENALMTTMAFGAD